MPESPKQKFKKKFVVYRANKAGNGCTISFDLAADKESVFLSVAPQKGTNDNNNAVFDWKGGSITVKLGHTDIGEMLAVFSGRKQSAGFKGSLFHKSNDGSNKIIALSKMQNDGYSIKISCQSQDKSVPIISHGAVLSDGDVEILSVLLKHAIIKFLEW